MLTRDAQHFLLTSNSFGEIVRTARTNLRLTQRELALRCDGISPEYISQIESGQKVPETTLVERLAEVLQIERRRMLLLAYWEKTPEEIRTLLLSNVVEETDAEWEQYKQVYLQFIRGLPNNKKHKVLTILQALAAEEEKEEASIKTQRQRRTPVGE